MFQVETVHLAFHERLRASSGCRYGHAGHAGSGEVPPQRNAVANVFWADTLTVTWYNWYKRVDSTDTTGHNTQAEVWLDACGSRWWYIEIADPDAGDAATLVGAYYGYF